MTILPALTAFDPGQPFRFEFFQRGLLVAGAVGAVCGIVGVFVVLRSMSYVGHGLSHAAFGGAALAAAGGVSMMLGGALWTVVAAVAIGRVTRRSGLGADAVIGVITTASFAIGLMVLSRRPSRSLDAVLFGDVLGVDGSLAVAVVLAAVAISTVVVALRRPLVLATWSVDVARVQRLPVARHDAIVMVAIALTVVGGARVVGAVLASALLVLPAATARLIGRSFTATLWLAPLIGAGSGLVGLYVAWFADVPAGASITLVAAVTFVVAYLLTVVVAGRGAGEVAVAHW